jgi:hypothetical protein
MTPCPDGTFPEFSQRKCQPCSPSCKQCAVGQPGTCLACYPGYGLTLQAKCQENCLDCQTPCPLGQAYNAATKMCQVCGVKCVYC